MERRFDMTDFEQSLRDHADQFIMVPSKRVWNGIYNNLHPGSSWPSITVALIFLFTLIGIGHLNNATKQISNTTSSFTQIEKNNPNKQIASQNSTLKIHSYDINSVFPSPEYWSVIKYNSIGVKDVTSHFVGKDVLPANMNSGNHDPVNNIAPTPGNKKFTTKSKDENVLANDITKKLINPNNLSIVNGNLLRNKPSAQDLSPQEINSIRKNFDNFKNDINNNDFVINNNLGFIKNNEMPFVINNIQRNDLLKIFSLNLIQPTKIYLVKNIEFKIENENNLVINNEKKTENKKLKTIHKKKNPKINWVYFVTPAINSVSFRGKALQPNVNQSFSSVVIPQGQNGGNMLYNARLGFQAGTQMTYGFSSKWQFVTGFNLSYSGYNVISNQVHPTFAYLMLKDEHGGSPYAKSYITHYGNGQGQNQISLSNTSLQASIPVGLQYILWSNKNVKINITSSIGPSFVLKNDAYIISSDGRNYVNDPTLLRKFNLAGDLGSFVTFSSSKIKWQVGPTVRYQMLSTYRNVYPLKEHLIDYGIRIGISR